MKRCIILVIFALFLSSCTPYGALVEPEIADLIDPASSYIQGTLAFDLTLENVVKRSTHIAIIELIGEPEPFDSISSIYTFSVQSILAGEELQEKTIKVWSYNNFFIPEETYLLFLSLMSSPSYPYDIYTSFSMFTFRVTDGDHIDCLQQVDSSTFQTNRTFANPFESPDHNTLSFLKTYFVQRPDLLKKSERVSDNLSLEHLISESDTILEITPSRIFPANAFVSKAWVDSLGCFKGETLPDIALALPKDIQVGEKFLVFFKQSGDGGFELTSRLSIFPEDSPEYAEFMQIHQGN